MILGESLPITFSFYYSESVLSSATVEPETGWSGYNVWRKGRDKEDGEGKKSGVERGARVLSGE